MRFRVMIRGLWALLSVVCLLGCPILFAQSNYRVIRGLNRQALILDAATKSIKDLGGSLDSDPVSVELQGDIHVFGLLQNQTWYRSVLKTNWINLGGTCAEIKNLKATATDITIEGYCGARPTVYSRTLTAPWVLINSPDNQEIRPFSPNIFEGRYVVTRNASNEAFLWDLLTKTALNLGGAFAADPIVYRSDANVLMIRGFGVDNIYWERTADQTGVWNKVVVPDSSMYKIMKGLAKQVLVLDFGALKIKDLGGVIDSNPVGLEYNGDVYVFGLLQNQTWYRSVLKTTWTNLGGTCAEIKLLKPLASDLAIEAYCAGRPTVYKRTLTTGWVLDSAPSFDEITPFVPTIFEGRYVATLGKNGQAVLWDLQTLSGQDFGGSFAKDPIMFRGANNVLTLRALGKNGSYWERDGSPSGSWKAMPGTLAESACKAETKDSGNFSVSASVEEVYQIPGGGAKQKTSLVDKIVSNDGSLFAVALCGAYSACTHTYKFTNISSAPIKVTDCVTNVLGGGSASCPQVGIEIKSGESFSTAMSFASQVYLGKVQKVEVGLKRISFSDGSSFNLWNLTSNRSGSAFQDMDYLKFKSAEVAPLVRTKNLSLIQTAQSLIGNLDPQYGANRFKELYSLGAFLGRFPRTHQYFDATIFKRHNDECLAQANYTQEINCVVMKKMQLEKDLFGEYGSDLLKYLPDQILKPYKQTDFGSNPIEIDPSLSNPAPAMSVVVYHTGSQEDAIAYNLRRGTPISSNSTLNFSNYGVVSVKEVNNVFDVKIVGTDLTSTINGIAESQSWFGGGLYRLQLSHSVPEGVIIKDIVLEAPNMDIQSYTNIDAPFYPSSSKFIDLRFEPRTWVVKDGRLMVSYLKQNKQKVIIVFETLTNPRKKFIKVFRFDFDNRLASGVKKMEAQGISDTDRAAYVESLEPADSTVTYRRAIESEAPYVPVVCGAGKKIDFHAYLNQRSRAKPAGGGPQPAIALPSVYGRIVLQGQSDITTNLKSQFYSGMDVDNQAMAQALSAGASNGLTEAYNEPVLIMPDGGSVSFGSTTTAKAKYRFISLRNNLSSTLRVVESPSFSGAAFQLFQSSSFEMEPFGSAVFLIKFTPWAPGSYYSSVTFKLDDGQDAGHTFWLGAEVSDVAVPVVTQTVAAEPQVFVDGKLLDPLGVVEADVGVVTQDGGPWWVDAIVKNPSTSNIEISSISISGKFLVNQSAWAKRSSRILKPGEWLPLRISVDSRSIGAVSGFLSIAYLVGGVSKTWKGPIGGLSWGESIERTEQFSQPGMPFGLVPVYPPGGSADKEVVDLANAQTAEQFLAIYPGLAKRDGERYLTPVIGSSTTWKNTWDYIRASKRATLSDGAYNLMKSSKQALELEDPQALLTRVSGLMSSMNKDVIGKGRADLIRSLSAISTLQVGLQTYTKLALETQTVDRLPGANALGRHYLRLAFVRAYLATNPPRSEAWDTLQPMLAHLLSPLARQPIIDLYLAQYPEVAGALGELNASNSP